VSSFALWIAVLLPSVLLTVVGTTVYRHAPVPSAFSFILAFPIALLCLKSARTSAIGFVLLLLWDVLSATWPHVFIDASFFQSKVDVMLLAATLLSGVIAFLIPSGGLIQSAENRT